MKVGGGQIKIGSDLLKRTPAVTVVEPLKLQGIGTTDADSEPIKGAVCLFWSLESIEPASVRSSEVLKVTRLLCGCRGGSHGNQPQQEERREGAVVGSAVVLLGGG